MLRIHFDSWKPNQCRSCSKQPPQSLPCAALPSSTLYLQLLRHIPICLQVHFIQRYPFRSLQQLPSNIHDQHDRQLDVEADKIHAVEVWAEAAPTLNEDEYRVEDDSEPRANGIRPVSKGKKVRFALESKSGTEADRGYADCDPTQLV